MGRDIKGPFQPEDRERYAGGRIKVPRIYGFPAESRDSRRWTSATVLQPSFSANKPILLQWVVGATATYSVVVGVIFFMGGTALLPVLGG
jgi:hypothetical protein